jgi:hypothetical protein
VIPTDTSVPAHAIQIQVQIAMSGEQRLLLAFEMSLFARELAAARIRQENPHWPERLIVRELTRLALLPEPLPARLR